MMEHGNTLGSKEVTQLEGIKFLMRVTEVVNSMRLSATLQPCSHDQLNGPLAIQQRSHRPYRQYGDRPILG